MEPLAAQVLALREAAVTNPSARRGLAEVRRQLATPERLAAVPLPGPRIGPELLLGLALLGTLALVVARRQRRRWWGWVALPVWLLCAWGTGATPQPGVRVVTSPAVVRAGNGPSYPAVLSRPLAAGTEVVVTHRRGGWARISISGGADAWVEAEVLAPDAGVP